MPHRFAARNLLIAAIAATGLAAGCAQEPEPQFSPAAPAATDSSAASSTTGSSAASPCGDPAAEDLGGGFYVLDGQRYELIDGACLATVDSPDQSGTSEQAAGGVGTEPTLPTESEAAEPTIAPAEEQSLVTTTTAATPTTAEAENVGSTTSTPANTTAEPTTTTAAPTTTAEPTTTTAAPTTTAPTTTVPTTTGETGDTAGVTGPPAALGFDPFYEKYVDLEGLPILSSARVPDAALLQARRLISEMLTDRRDVLSTLAANDVRVAIVAESSGITELPELSDLYEAFPGVDWDNRTRGGGVGPTFARPVLAIAEENLLCYSTDRFPYEDIVVHEAAHAVLNMGIELQSGGPAFRQRLESAYQDALDAGLWQGTYAAENPDEYWAEGVQSWFDVNDPPGPIHNEINTRRELQDYDPALAALVREVLGDVTVPSSCHSAALHPPRDNRILGTLLGPDGTGVEGVALWAWSGEASTSGSSTTQSDGTFAIAAPDGSFTLDVHANTGEDCTFIGWYGPDGFTTVRESATLVVVDDADVSGIEIILPQELEDLPFIEWCA